MQWISGAAVIVLILGWLLLRLRCGSRYDVLRSLTMEGLKLRAARYPSCCWLRNGKFPAICPRWC